MNYNISTTEYFERKFKRLFKKYRSLKSDLAGFIKDLRDNPAMGDDLGDNTRKVRMAITSKNKGKSGGARIITYQILVDWENADIYLLTIYDKSEQETISKQEIQQIKEITGLI
ncbi:MAG: type II toxin-antitoxin system RelE/ParE family toxin [Bacteroidetes bacterium]|nr:type II toxin-antitoxin system RelE/ParE family toxin [Bacteroidota bacterium]